MASQRLFARIIDEVEAHPVHHVGEAEALSGSAKPNGADVLGFRNPIENAVSTRRTASSVPELGLSLTSDIKSKAPSQCLTGGQRGPSPPENSS